MSKKNQVLIVFAVILVSLAVIFSRGSKHEKAVPAVAETSTTSSTTAPAQARDSVTIELVGRDSTTVFDLLKEKHNVESWSTALGVFVKGIDSTVNSPRVNWVYSINDSMPQVASDKVMTRNGDRVVWHFRIIN